MKRTLLATAVISLLVSSIATFGAQAAPEEKRVYIVKFNDNVSVGNEIAEVRRSGIAVNAVLENVFKGFIGEMTAGQANALSRQPRVDFVEADAEVSIAATQTGATWGLDRIDQRSLPLSSTYSYSSTTDGYSSEGSGVKAYVIDTGILTTHTEFTGRTAAGISYVNDRRGTVDCNGHGTHVAGTIGGTKYGVAKRVTLVPVRVLDCRGSGTNSGVISGINWVASQVDANKNKIADFPAVANLSLGGGISTAVDSAIKGLFESGASVVVAAGNSTADACSSSPARAPEAITVGATASNDSRASYSNFGTCLDIFAPGSSITSAWHKSTTAINTISGTSMASPHVAGVVARYLSENPTATPTTVASVITSSATTGKVTDARTGSPNLLLYAPFSFRG